MIARPRLTAVAALAAALAISGCGSSGQTSQARAAAYVRRVDRVEQGLTAPLGTVTAAAARLAGTSRGTPPSSAQTSRQAAALRSAEARIRAAAGRLAALPAPADARPLRATVLRLLTEQVALTEQTARLVQFLPAFDRSLTPLGPATLRLERSLAVNQASGASAVAAVYASKARALQAFAAAVQRIARRLQGLRAPEVSLPTLRGELISLGGMRTASRALATALAAGRTTGLDALLRRFDRAAALSASPAVRAEQAAAIRRYDRQVEGVSQLSAQAQRARVQLATRLGTGAS